MSVDVNKLKDRFTDKMNDLYNQDVYFVESCVKYCDKDSKNIIRLINISDEVGSPDINIVNNYIVDDKWEKTDW